MKNKIITQIFSYGLVPMLIVMKEQEQLENYEFCERVLQAIQDVYPDKSNIPTNYSEDALIWAINEFELLNTTGKTAFFNMNEYVNIIYRNLKMIRTYDAFICS